MLLQVRELISQEQVVECRKALERVEWVDGNVTAGHQSARAKDNQQLQEDDPVVTQLREMLVVALERNPLFMSAALPLKVFPPLFNRYQEGQSFGNHVDNAIRQVTGTGHRVRTDLSATLFFSEPDEYEGGELLVEDTFGIHAVKLPAGHLILYPASSLHRVQPITRGVRLAAFFWVQSMVRDDGERTLLFDLDMAIQRCGDEMPNNPGVVQLTSVYHNLLRRWADV